MTTNPILAMLDHKTLYAFDESEKKAIGVPSEKVHPFITESMVPLLQKPHDLGPSTVELRDDQGKVVAPYKFKANCILMSPNIFGKGLTLWIDGQKVVALDMAAWKRVANFKDTIFH